MTTTSENTTSCCGVDSSHCCEEEISKESVQEYYGKILSKSDDLQTNACCSADAIPLHLRQIISQIAPEVVEKFYGCGSPVPPAIEGSTILDLGCGTGRDVFLCSKLVGENGKVIGIDMTTEQLEVARRHQHDQAKTFGFHQPNTEFIQGYIEDLSGVEDSSVDVVISNCVINLSPDKRKVFSEIMRVLKPGGEIYFSDVFADRRIPAELKKDPVLTGECLAGALYWEDFRRMMFELGVPDIRVMSTSKITIDNPEIEDKLGGTKFDSITVRCFKLPSLEDRCEDYGQVAIYKGGIEGSPHFFALDDHHLFEKDRPMLVCGNTAAMVEETRFGKYFEVTGNREKHFGLFPCGPSPEPSSVNEGSTCC